MKQKHLTKMKIFLKAMPQHIPDNVTVYTVGDYAKKRLLYHRPLYKSKELLYYVPKIM